MTRFYVGDLVLVINSDYNSDIIGHAGTVASSETQISGNDKYGCCVSGRYAVVDLPYDINRFGTTLWYLKPEYLIKILPDTDVKDSENSYQILT